MRPPLRAVADDDVDRPQVGALRDVEPSGTNGPKARGRAGVGSPPALEPDIRKGKDAIVERVCNVRQTSQGRRARFSLLPGSAARDTSGGYGAGAHLFPSRTEKLSPAAAMILRETVGK